MRLKQFINVILICTSGFVLGYFSSISALVIEIPQDYQSIQEGIDQAAAGDTVLVAPDTYYENIDFSGKDILLTSFYMYDYDPYYIENTIIDGIYAPYLDAASTVTFSNNETGNAVLQGFTVKGGSGTAWIDPQFPSFDWYSGGGIFIYMASPTIRNNHITMNIVSNDGSYDGASGGGLLCFRGNPTIIGNVFSHNQADYGAGIVVDYSGAIIRNNIIRHNSGGQLYGGGGFYSIGNDLEPIIVENNTIIGNHSETTGGALRMWTSTVTVRNNIIWGNTQLSGGPISGGGGSDITYCNIEGGYTGDGNIDSEPSFTDTTTYILDPSCACVDAGNPDPLYNDPEDPYNPGYGWYPARGTVINDIGAYGGPLTLTWNYTPSNQELLPPSQSKILELRNFPNPFNPRTRIGFRLSESGFVSLRVFNLKGQLVKSLLHSHHQAGEHTITWDGTDNCGNPVNSGFYFYKLNADARDKTRKCLLLK